MSKIKIAIADDGEIAHLSINSKLREYSDMEVVINAQDGLELMEEIKHKNADIILLDISMPGLDGPSTAKALYEQNHPARIIYFSKMLNPNSFDEYFNAGNIRGAVDKDRPIKELASAIYEVMDNGFYYNEYITPSRARLFQERYNLDKAGGDKLTVQQKAILEMLIENKPVKEISETLIISARTVAREIERMQQKANVDNIYKLFHYAGKNQLLD